MDKPTGMIFERQRDRQDRTDVKATYRATIQNGYPGILHRQYPEQLPSEALKHGDHDNKRN
jgi:hypothetical protein